MSKEETAALTQENVNEVEMEGAVETATFDQAGPETVGNGSDIRVVDGGMVPDSGTVKNVRFSPLPQASVAGEQNPMDLLFDVDLDLRVELGHATLPVREVLQLGPGSIVELEKLAGEPVDIMVNGKMIARGEVVVVDENFGIRVTEIANRAERLSGLA